MSLLRIAPLFLALLASSWACHDCDNKGDMRCADGVHEVCNKDYEWEIYDDCPAQGLVCYEPCPETGAKACCQ